MAINWDYIDPVQLTGYVRETPGPRNYTLNTFLPDVFLGEIDVAWDIVNRTNRAAMYRSFDAESPLGQRDSFSRARVSLPPISQKTVVGEYERLKLEQIRSGGDTRNRLVAAIYDDADINTNAIRARVELARGDVLTDWKFTLAGENGLTLEADFGMPTGHDPTPSTAWTDHTNSDPISDLQTWVQKYTDDAGEAPGRMLTSRTVVGHMLMNTKVRTYLSSLAGAPQMVTRAQLNSVLDAFELPPIVTYDTSIDVNGSATRPIPADRLALLPTNPRDLGFTAWGVTAEALELAGQQNPGLAFSEAPGLVGVVLRDGDPVRIWTKVAAIVMPVITDPRKLLVADVL